MREHEGSTRRVDRSISAHTGLTRGVPGDHEVQSVNRETNISACERETNSHTHSRPRYCKPTVMRKEPEHLPRTNDHEVAQAE